MKIDWASDSVLEVIPSKRDSYRQITSNILDAAKAAGRNVATLYLRGEVLVAWCPLEVGAARACSDYITR
jgi:hypothetical protein